MVKEKLEVYKCEVCGNMVEVINEGIGELICCNKPMQLLKEHTEDKGLEKHVPVIKEEKGKVIVEIGDIEHPMTQEHYIQWIELTVDGKSCKKFLKPNDKPRAEFNVTDRYKIISAREYCNIHGLWSA